MSFKDFRVLETIGKGSFASVYKVIRKSDNKVYALKRVKINKMSKKEIADALNEIRFLASIRHKNIVGFLEAFLENNETELCIVMEFCGCGDLAQKVERYKRRRQYIDEDVVWRYLIQCLKALSNLHEKGIAHRDLKVANTFLAEDGSAKIGDMNVSKRLQRGQLKTQIGTPYYMSPEIWNNRPYDATSDIWSLGCMMYELAALKPPFQGNSFPELKRAVIAGRYTAIPRKYSDGLHRVVAQMLRVNPRERPSADRLLASPDIAAKLRLDEPSAATANHHPSTNNARMALMATIKVPQNLKKLQQGGLLPKPCYPDKRPDSPTAWTVAEQVHANKKKAAAAALVPPPPPMDSKKDSENIPPPPSERVSTTHTAQGGKEKVYIPSEALKGGEKGAPSAAALADYYIRRPLQPAADGNVNAAPAAPSGRAALPPAKPRGGGYADYRHIQSRYAQGNINKQPEAINRPRIPYGHAGAAAAANPRVAGHPVRVQYQHRMW